MVQERKVLWIKNKKKMLMTLYRKSKFEEYAVRIGQGCHKQQKIMRSPRPDLDYSKLQLRGSRMYFQTETCHCNIITAMKARTMWQARHIARMENNRNAYKVLVRRTEGKRRPGRRRSGWKVVTVDLKKCGSVDWSQLAQDKAKWQVLVNTVIKIRVLQCATS
jgi:hypothetical protein